MKRSTLAIALTSMIACGAMLSACGGKSGNQAQAGDESAIAGDATADAAFGADHGSEAAVLPAEPKLEYADVLKVAPVTERRQLHATVIGSEAIRETSTVNTPREVCEDVVVQERLPERDGNVGGTVAGAVIGGIVGSNVGSGSGRRAATAAGAVAGGVIGNRVDARHERGQVVERVDRQCRTVHDTSQSSRVVAYNVTFRNPDGTTGTMRTDSKPGNRIPLGNETVTVGYDVTYRFDGVENTVRMDKDPGQRLPVVDGEVVIQTASAGTPSRG